MLGQVNPSAMATANMNSHDQETAQSELRVVRTAVAQLGGALFSTGPGAAVIATSSLPVREIYIYIFLVLVRRFSLL